MCQSPGPGDLDSSFDGNMFSKKFTLNPRTNNQGFQSQLNNKDDNYRLKKILRKALPIRTLDDRQFITDFIEGNHFLSSMSKKISYQFVNNLLNNGIIVQATKGKVIGEQGKNIEHVGIVLAGKLGVHQKQQNKIKEQVCGKDQLWSKLIQQSNKYVRKIRKFIRQDPQKNLSLSDFGKNRRKSSNISICPEWQNSEKQNSFDSINQFININQSYGFFDRATSLSYTSTYVSVQPTKLFLIKIQDMLSYLQQAFRLKLKALYTKLSKLSYFNFLQQETLNEIIKILNIHRKKRGYHIYKEGQQSHNLYFLEQGEITINKTTQLFKQNPNQLYTQRDKLIQEGYKLNNNKQRASTQSRRVIQKIVKKQKLPYANLQAMYNYIPKSKVIQIGTITDFCLFGEEQLLQNKCRETNTVCNTLYCQYYSLNLKKAEEILGTKNSAIMRQQLRKSLITKVLNRQNNYSKALTIQNKNNMKYFYEQKGRVEQSPLRIKLLKFNRLIQQQESSPEQIQCSQIIAKKKSSIQPLYDAFNFEKMVKKNLDKKNKSNSLRNSSLKYDCQKDLYRTMNTEQLDMMNITHTWQLMQEKVSKQKVTARKISSLKQKITFKKPLFERQYLQDYDKEKKKVDMLEQRKNIQKIKIGNQRHKFTINSPTAGPKITL